MGNVVQTQLFCAGCDPLTLIELASHQMGVVEAQLGVVEAQLKTCFQVMSAFSAGTCFGAVPTAQCCRPLLGSVPLEGDI